jgi:hypothetical protein
MTNKFYKDVILKHYDNASNVKYVLATQLNNVILGDEEENREGF